MFGLHTHMYTWATHMCMCIQTYTHKRQEERKGKACWEGLRHSRSMGIDISESQLSSLAVTVYRISETFRIPLLIGF